MLYSLVYLPVVTSRQNYFFLRFIRTVSNLEVCCATQMLIKQYNSLNFNIGILSTCERITARTRVRNGPSSLESNIAADMICKSYDYSFYINRRVRVT